MNQCTIVKHHSVNTVKLITILSGYVYINNTGRTWKIYNKILDYHEPEISYPFMCEYCKYKLFFILKIIGKG